jgi:hypothetical protein
MNRDVLIGAGVVLAFIVLVNRAKNNQVTEPQGGGGGGGGGFGGVPFPPMPPMPPTPPTPPTPRPYNQGRSYTAADNISRGTVQQPVTTESLSNKDAIDRGGITGMGTGTGTSSTGTGTSSTSSTVQYNPKTDYYAKLPFSGVAMDAKFMGFVGSTPKFEFN